MIELQQDASRQAPPARVVSIDIFRGLTMAVMIFVNELSDVHGLPWWTYHAHAQEDRMTYVDMVFPFFLFLVGMSLPLSVEQRLKRNPSRLALWAHLLTRVVGLLVLGLILANAESGDAVRMGLSGGLWALLGLLSAGLYLNVYPKGWRAAPYLRGAGLVGVAVLLAVFRRRLSNGGAAWLDFSYPEILGLIGLSYLGLVLLYVPTRRWKWAPAAWFALCAAFCAACAAQLVQFPDQISMYLWPFSNGALVCVMMAGVLTTVLFLGTGTRPAAGQAMLAAVLVAVATLAAGWRLAPLGISKIRATPTWALWSAGAAMLVFTLLYWICDVRRKTRWAFFLRPAGANTLTTYLLPDLWDFATMAAGVRFFETHWSYGWSGVVKTVIFTAAMLALSRLVTRARIRLQF